MKSSTQHEATPDANLEVQRQLRNAFYEREETPGRREVHARFCELGDKARALGAEIRQEREAREAEAAEAAA